MDQMRGKIDWDSAGSLPSFPSTTENPMNIFGSETSTMRGKRRTKKLPKLQKSHSKMQEELVSRMLSKLPYDVRDSVLGVVDLTFNTMSDLEGELVSTKRQLLIERRNRSSLQLENDNLTKTNTNIKMNLENLKAQYKATKRGAKDAFRQVVQQKVEMERMREYHQPFIDLVSSFTPSSSSQQQHKQQHSSSGLPSTKNRGMLDTHGSMENVNNNNNHHPSTADSSRPVTTSQQQRSGNTKPINELSAISFASSMLAPISSSSQDDFMDHNLDSPVDFTRRSEKVRSQGEWLARQNEIMKLALSKVTSENSTLVRRVTLLEESLEDTTSQLTQAVRQYRSLQLVMAENSSSSAIKRDLSSNQQQSGEEEEEAKGMEKASNNFPESGIPQSSSISSPTIQRKKKKKQPSISNSSESASSDSPKPTLRTSNEILQGIDRRLNVLISKNAVDLVDLTTQLRTMQNLVISLSSCLVEDQIGKRASSRDAKSMFGCESMILFLVGPNPSVIHKYSSDEGTKVVVGLNSLNGVVGKVFERGESIRLNEMADSVTQQEMFDERSDGFRSIQVTNCMTLPVWNAKRTSILGVVHLINKKRGEVFSELDELVSQLFTSQLGMICSSSRRMTRIENRTGILSNMMTIPSIILSSIPDTSSLSSKRVLNERDVIESLERAVTETLNSSKVQVFLSKTTHLIYLNEEKEITQARIGSGIAGKMANKEFGGNPSKKSEDIGKEDEEDIQPSSYPTLNQHQVFHTHFPNKMDMDYIEGVDLGSSASPMISFPITDGRDRVIAVVQLTPSITGPHFLSTLDQEALQDVSIEEGCILFSQQAGPYLEYVMGLVGREGRRLYIPSITPHSLSAFDRNDGSSKGGVDVQDAGFLIELGRSEDLTSGRRRRRRERMRKKQQLKKKKKKKGEEKDFKVVSKEVKIKELEEEEFEEEEDDDSRSIAIEDEMEDLTSRLEEEESSLETEEIIEKSPSLPPTSSISNEAEQLSQVSQEEEDMVETDLVPESESVDQNNKEEKKKEMVIPPKEKEMEVEVKESKEVKDEGESSKVVKEDLIIERVENEEKVDVNMEEPSNEGKGEEKKQKEEKIVVKEEKEEELNDDDKIEEDRGEVGKEEVEEVRKENYPTGKVFGDWEEWLNVEGTAFYIHSTTQQSVWEIPKEVSFQEGMPEVNYNEEEEEDDGYEIDL